MFGFLKKALNKIADYNNDQDFFDFIHKKYETNSNELFATFSQQGFSLVIDLMIQKAKHDLDMFIKDKKSFLDPLKIIMLEEKIKSFTSTGGMIIISTFGGENDSQLNQLKEKYPNNFNYIPLKCKNADDVNSFIIIDNKSYLIDDPTWNKATNMYKAEVNFFDYSKSASLIQKFKSYTGVYSNTMV